MTVKTQSGIDTGIPVVPVVQIPWCPSCGKERSNDHLVKGFPTCKMCGRTLMYRLVEYPAGTIPVIDERFIEKKTKHGYTGILGIKAKLFPILEQGNIKTKIEAEQDARFFKQLELDGEILVWDEQPCV